MQEEINYRDAWAEAIVLPGESKDHFLVMLENLEQTFRPASPTERNLVLDIAATSWHRARLFSLEMMLFRSKMAERQEKFPEADPVQHAIEACESFAADPRCLDLLGRWQMRHHKIFQDNVRLLLLLELKKHLPNR